MKERMRVFVSTPMSGRTEEEIKKDFARAKLIIHKATGLPPKQIEIMDTYSPNIFPDDDNIALYCLGKSIEAMGQADIVLFMSGWYKSRGCKIESMCADLYGKEVMHEVYDVLG